MISTVPRKERRKAVGSRLFQAFGPGTGITETATGRVRVIGLLGLVLGFGWDLEGELEDELCKKRVHEMMMGIHLWECFQRYEAVSLERSNMDAC